MSIWKLSYKNLRHRRLLSCLTILAVAIASALVVFILLMNKGLEKGAKSGYGPYELVIGADGSGSQLVLNTFYHLGTPTGNIPYGVYEDIKKHEMTDTAYAIARGDSYQGFPIVGTDSGYLTTRYPEAALQKGALYKTAGETVIGSYVAQKLGLKLGDTFHGSHGLHSEEEHEGLTFKVVGILPQLGTPDDKAMFTALESVWQVHEGEAAAKDVTAIVVKPKGLVEAQLLKKEFHDYEGVQAVYSGKAIADILSVMDKGAQVIQVIALASILIAAISVLLSLSAMAAERQKDVGLLRLLGKPKSYIVAGLLLEANLLCAAGLAAGMLLGHTVSFLLQDEIFQYTGVEIQAWALLLQELYIPAGGLLLGSVAAMLPAIRSYRVDPLRLFAS